MKVLLLGANGFIGARLGARLIQAGHTVAAGVRDPDHFLQSGYSRIVDCDFSVLPDIDDWRERVRGYDAVVNCVGILRESGDSSFKRIHIETPAVIHAACEAENVMRLIQISALGNPADTEFIASKHQGDQQLESSQLEWTIFRPSVVYSPQASYGGTSLLRAMSALPLTVLPGSGQQQIQPVDLDDLAKAVVNALDDSETNGKIIEVAGPMPVSIHDYLLAHRSWLGLPPAPVIRTPLWLTTVVAHLGERLGAGPLGLTMLSMLSRGNVASSGSLAKFASLLGRQPRSIVAALSRHPASQADLWHARLYFVGPLMRICIAVLFLLSGVVGLLTPGETGQSLLAEAGITGSWGGLLIDVASVLDILLGSAFLMNWKIRITGLLMLLMLLAYSLFVGLLIPRFWMEPFGSLIKNIPLLPAILMVMVMDQKR
jgi:uncharacterized protein YbjT (DUF2867 family)